MQEHAKPNKHAFPEIDVMVVLLNNKTSYEAQILTHQLLHQVDGGATYLQGIADLTRD